MHADLTLSSWVAVRDGCRIRYNVQDNDDVVFVVGSERNTFGFVFDPASLRTFLGLCAAAVHELDTTALAGNQPAAKPDLGVV